MYSTIKRLYDNGLINDTGVQNAVTKGWITQEEMDEIVNA